jgi:hypothetical protein
MAIQKFPLTTLLKIRQYIQKSLMPAESEQFSQSAITEDVFEIPKPTSLDALGNLFKLGGLAEPELSASAGRWLLSTVNPASALLKLPGLQLKPQFRLVGYLYRMAGDGAGMVWAVPEDYGTTAQLEQALPKRHSRHQPPQPKAALPNFMSAIEGNRTLPSFLIASILRRELAEFGALGHYCDWSHHRLIDVVPSQLLKQVGAGQLKDLTPRVRSFPTQQVAVEFFTCRVVAPIGIFRHIDLYAVDTYVANSLDRAITGT